MGRGPDPSAAGAREPAAETFHNEHVRERGEHANLSGLDGYRGRRSCRAPFRPLQLAFGLIDGPLDAPRLHAAVDHAQYAVNTDTPAICAASCGTPPWSWLMRLARLGAGLLYLFAIPSSLVIPADRPDTPRA